MVSTPSPSLGLGLRHSASLTPPTPFVYVSEPGNQIGDEGARALADGVKGLEGLKELNLGGECVIGCWSSPTITNATRTSPSPPRVGGKGVVVWWVDVNVNVNVC